MESISSNKRNNEATIANKKLHTSTKKQSLISKMGRGLTFILFLLLFNYRRPIRGMIGVIGGFCGIFFSAVFTLPYMSGQEHFSLETKILAVIFFGPLCLLCLAINWYYDKLLLKLAPPDIQLTLFQ
ncbi:hypothetical protein [Bartonella sp. CB178]|uniref:hypothetical protein n=1 Tax=Bartonella sp. CB178 TaxID=3112255 RepID=UPI00300E2D2A